MKILITGATSGIGEQLALHYSAQGNDVIACGRNEKKLAQLSAHNSISCCRFDVTDLAQIKHSTAEIEQLDCVILNAGVCEYINDAKAFDSAVLARVVNGNLLSIGYCLEALLSKIKPSGQLVIVSSSVTYLPLPRAQAYGAAKAGVSYLAKSLAIDLDDIAVTLVHPGFVKTPLTDKNDFAMPMAISAEKAAHYIIKGINKRVKEVHFPYRFTFILKLLTVLPWPLWLRLAKGLSR